MVAVNNSLKTAAQITSSLLKDVLLAWQSSLIGSLFSHKPLEYSSSNPPYSHYQTVDPITTALAG